MPQTNDKQTAIRLPANLYAALERIAQKEDRAVSYIIRRACEREVKRVGRAKKREK